MCSFLKLNFILFSALLVFLSAVKNDFNIKQFCLEMISWPMFYCAFRTEIGNIKTSVECLDRSTLALPFVALYGALCLFYANS